METPTVPKWRVFYLAATCLCLLITLLPVNCCLGDQEYGHFTSVHEWCFVDPWIARIPQDDTMTFSWHHDIPLIGFWGRKTVVGGWWHVFFHGMTHIIHDLPGFFPRPHVWNAVIDWSGQSSRKKRFSVHLHSQMSCCHCLGETPYVFFWAGPQSQWSMQNRLFGCEHSNWPRCKSLGFPKTAFFTQFSVRLLATQSVSKFSCQVLIQNKLYIAMYIHTWLYIYIFHNSYTILHTHKACYVSSQVAKNPSAWWVICGVFSSPGCNVLDRRFKSCGRCYNMSSSKARSGRDFCRRSGWARWIYWDEPKKRIWVCYFCWDVCGEVWWNATDYLGPKRFGNRSRTAERKEHFQEEVKHRNV